MAILTETQLITASATETGSPLHYTITVTAVKNIGWSTTNAYESGHPNLLYFAAHNSLMTVAVWNTATSSHDSIQIFFGKQGSASSTYKLNTRSINGHKVAINALALDSRDSEQVAFGVGYVYDPHVMPENMSKCVIWEFAGASNDNTLTEFTYSYSVNCAEEEMFIDVAFTSIWTTSPDESSMVALSDFINPSTSRHQSFYFLSRF